MENENQNAPVATLNNQELRLTWPELANTLSQSGKLELKPGEPLVIHQIELTDFIALVEETKPEVKAALFADMIRRLALDISFEGSIALGPFNLAEQSLTLSAHPGSFLRIRARPRTFTKSLTEIVSFLSKLPVGHALVLKANQDLFIQDLSADAMFSYYQCCQDEGDVQAREKGQDKMFLDSCPMLEEKGLLLKIYGLNVQQVDRAINAAEGGVLFKPVGNDELKEPRIVLGLVAKS
jgi:hypothetical protein